MFGLKGGKNIHLKTGIVMLEENPAGVLGSGVLLLLQGKRDLIQVNGYSVGCDPWEHRRILGNSFPEIK